MDDSFEGERPGTLFGAGLSLYKQKRFTEALPYFDRAIESDASLGAAWAFRGVTYFALHREPEATLHNLDQGLALLEFPSDETGRRAQGLFLGFRAAVLSDLHRHAEAIAALDETRQYRPLSAWLLLVQGVSYRALGQKWQAISAFRAALEDNRGDDASSDSWLRAASALLEFGDYHSALEATERAVQKAPERALAWTQRAQALLALKRYQECLDSIDQALALKDRDYFAWGVKGAALRGLKRYDEARAAFRHAQELAPPDYRAREPSVMGEFRMLLRLRRFGQAWRLALDETQLRLREQRAPR
jgi:tetratricopeptide (TPR) repeat protein